MSGKFLDATEYSLRVGMDIVPPYNRYLSIIGRDGEDIGTLMITEDQAKNVAETLERTFTEGGLFADVEDAFRGIDIDFPGGDD